MTPSSSLPWWRTDDYDGATRDATIASFAGPKGMALVRAWPDGRTDPGWGLTSPSGDGFMLRYMRGEFNERRVLYGYVRDKWAFAYVMRSLKLVVVDIDGKNGGLEHAKKLGMLPPTMAETSKSGNGYHLFYEHDEPWDNDKGFGALSDRIGIEQGVDIRATGCVYHHKQQRWNDRRVAKLPEFLRDLLSHREQKLAATHARIDTILADHDELEVLMLHDEIMTELKKPIPSGKRNVTLFAIGNQMRQAQIPGWEQLVTDRATAVGLPADETLKLISNINHYGSPVTP